jgi:prophage maintenance system killer protein
MTAFLHLNRRRLATSVDEAERMFLSLAGGEMDQPAFTDWVRTHLRQT